MVAGVRLGTRRGQSAEEVQAAIDAALVDPFPYDEIYPVWYANASSTITANALVIMEAPNRNTDLPVDEISLLVGATSNGNLKVCVYTFDGTTWTLFGSSPSTPVGPINTVQAVSLSSPVVVPRTVRRFYGIVTDGTATFQRMSGPNTALMLLEPTAAAKASSFILPSTMVRADLTSVQLIPWLRAGAS